MSGPRAPGRAAAPARARGAWAGCGWWSARGCDIQVTSRTRSRRAVCTQITVQKCTREPRERDSISIYTVLITLLLYRAVVFHI